MHSGLNYFTPVAVHEGLADDLVAKRQETMDQAYERNPGRFPKGRPIVNPPPKEAGINKNEKVVEAKSEKKAG